MFCGSIDAQGFIVEGEFRPRELTIVGDGLILHIEIDPELPINLSKKDECTNFYIKKNLTGMTYRPRNKVYTWRKVLSLIMQTYKLLCSDKKEYLAINNQQLEKLLEQLHIKVNRVTPSVLTNEVPVCNLHNSNIHRCSKRKAIHIWNWIKQQ